MADWVTYLAGFHARHAGVSEDVLARAESHGLTPYDWLARAVSGDRVLDLASGSGPMAATLAGRSGDPAQSGQSDEAARPWVVGLDLSHAELLESRRRGRGGPVVLADAAYLPFRTDTFDAVVSSAGLMVVSDVERVLAEVTRVLRPRGVLAVTVPSAVPLRRQDMRVLAPLTARLRTTPQFPSGGEMTGLTSTMESVGFRVLEDARERFGFVVRTERDAQLLIRSLYLPGTPDKRREVAATWLAERAEGEPDGVEIAIPIRRVVAMKTGREPAPVRPDLT